MFRYIVLAVILVALVSVLAVAKDNAARARLLSRLAVVTIVGYALVAALFIAGETVSDPGGWRAVGLIGAWAVPLAVLSVLAWYRPIPVTALLAAATAIPLALGVWFAVAPQAWRSFEDDAGPVRQLVSFVVVVPLGLLGRHRPVPAGLLLLVLGVVPVALADLAGVVPIFAVTSMGLVSAPAALVGAMYLLAVAFSPGGRPGTPIQRRPADRQIVRR